MRLDIKLQSAAGNKRSEMKKEKKDKPQEKKFDKHVGEDPSKLIAELAPGKKGGDFELPFGGKISIEAGFLNKKDLITCCMISPSDRYKYLPPLRSDEHLVSEIFLLATNVKSLKRNLTMRLPFYPENLELFDLQLLWKPPDGDEWMTKEFSKSEKGNFVEFVTINAGIYVVTSSPRRERFVIPMQGCLFNSKLSHQISVRFPKKATEIDLQCDITISPMNRENLIYLRQDFPHDMCDLITASEFVEVRPQVHKEFKRPATIKLPLPPMEDENFPHDDLVVMYMTPNGWDLHEGSLKITKTAVCFETKILSKYCVALAKPQRRKRLKEAFKHMVDDVSITRGEIVSFVHLQEKLWTLWVECVANDKLEDTVNRREKQGFTRVNNLGYIIEEEPENDKPVFRRSWKSRSKPEKKEPTRTDLDFINGQPFELDIAGDVKICDDDIGKNNTSLYFLDRLPESYRRFHIQPVGEPETSITGLIKAYAVDLDNKNNRKPVRGYNFDINANDAKMYWYEEPEPEPEPEREDTPLPEVEVKRDTPPPTPQVVKERPMTASFMRLITPTKPPRLLIKESKVLTGRSLMTLAREVDQGLTLAIHLDISDSTITGMGFDALASGLNLTDITYRILMLWKRRTSKFKAKQPHILAEAFKEMGRNDLADIVLERHQENKEILPECFTDSE